VPRSPADLFARRALDGPHPPPLGPLLHADHPSSPDSIDASGSGPDRTAPKSPKVGQLSPAELVQYSAGDDKSSWSRPSISAWDGRRSGSTSAAAERRGNLDGHWWRRPFDRRCQGVPRVPAGLEFAEHGEVVRAGARAVVVVVADYPGRLARCRAQRVHRLRALASHGRGRDGRRVRAERTEAV
jgi:hypothetical protein